MSEMPSWSLFDFFHPQHELYEGGVIVILILQVRKLRTREMKYLVQSHTTSNKQSVILTPIADVLPYLHHSYSSQTYLEVIKASIYHMIESFIKVIIAICFLIF